MFAQPFKGYVTTCCTCHNFHNSLPNRKDTLQERDIIEYLRILSHSHLQQQKPVLFSYPVVF